MYKGKELFLCGIGNLNTGKYSYECMYTLVCVWRGLKSTNQTLWVDNNTEKAEEGKNKMPECCPLHFIFSYY
jgi:hypothetical protein